MAGSPVFCFAIFFPIFILSYFFGGRPAQEDGLPFFGVLGIWDNAVYSGYKNLCVLGINRCTCLKNAGLAGKGALFCKIL